MNAKENDIALRWCAEGFSCDTWVDPPRQAWRGFVHTVDELIMLIEGQIEITIEGKVYYPTVGETVLIKAGQEHDVVNIGQQESRWYYGYRQG